jgi:hypothetical protein
MAKRDNPAPSAAPITAARRPIADHPSIVMWQKHTPQNGKNQISFGKILILDKK